MDSRHDHVALTSRERQLLDDLESATTDADPALDARLRTIRRGPLSWSPKQQLVVAVLFILAATAVLLGTFTRWLWLAGLAAVVDVAAMAIGLEGLRRSHGNRRRGT